MGNSFRGNLLVEISFVELLAGAPLPLYTLMVLFFFYYKYGLIS
jgi:hypothetical protein